MKKISGSCLCGAVLYSSDVEEPIMTAICHCENCQRQTGTAFSIIVAVPEDSISFENKDSLKEYLDQGQSGKAVHRKFCGDCGSPIMSLVDNAPGLGILKAGTLNDTSWLNPTIEFWCESSQPWLEFGDQMTQYDKNPG